MGQPGDVASTDLDVLLQRVVREWVGPLARVVAVTSLPVESGMSDAAIRRFRIVVREGLAEPIPLRVVAKYTTATERRVLALLRGQAGIPDSLSLDEPDWTGADDWVCLADLGDTARPSSLSPIDPALEQREIEVLAGLHAAWLRRPDAPGWLPPVDREWFAHHIEHWFFRRAWQPALRDEAFHDRFGDRIGAVETAASTIVAEMAELASDRDGWTVVHTDIHPSNVLVLDGQPYLIDWQAARRGPLYLDLPHHLSTPALAERYRLALAERGVAIPASVFHERYRLTARYIGLRYIWWAIEAWREDRSFDRWVEHYLGLIAR